MTAQEEHEFIPLLRAEYKPILSPYFISPPEIPSGGTYLFETNSGLKYEVLFAKKRDNYLCNIVNFSVLNDEFEDEYSETNRGEVYRIIATVIEIIRLYHEFHGYSLSYEFSGEFKDDEVVSGASIRTRLYYRKAKEIVHPDWNLKLHDNQVIIYRNNYKYV